MQEATLPGSALAGTLAAVLVGYVGVMFALGFVARGQISDVEDFLVAGRRLPLSLAWPTLLATWFGAGTLLVATDEVRAEGLRQAALDPFGAGACLLLAGAFFAGPLWRMRLLTLPDFFGRRFGPRAEWWAAVLMVPGYFGWVAAQFVAVAGVLELFFGIPPVFGIAAAAAVGVGYTWLGGMWSVTLTDAVQMAIVVIGLVVLGWLALTGLGAGDAEAGLGRLLRETPPDKLVIVPTESAAALFGWLGVFAAGALGNLPGQDLMQRVFAARSEGVARAACWLSGGTYLLFGIVPLGLGLAGNLLLPDEADTATLPLLAHVFLTPGLTVLLVLAVLSAVLSTIDSAILSPASVIAQNVMHSGPDAPMSDLARNRLAVLGVGAASLAVAYVGEDAWSILETAYEVGLVSLFVPLAVGLRRHADGERPALAAMGVGTGAWLAHLALGWETFLGPLGTPLPVGLSCAALAGVAYAAVLGLDRRGARAAGGGP